MIKRLVKHGNSAALIIDRPILEMLGMRQKSCVNVRTNGRVLIIEPADELEARIDQALDDDAQRERVLKALME